MKTAVYIEDGVTQLVLTPQTRFEKKLLEPFSQKSLDAKILMGSFYDCRGGWVRQSPIYGHRPPDCLSYPGHENTDKSLILVVRDADQSGE